MKKLLFGTMMVSTLLGTAFAQSEVKARRGTNNEKRQINRQQNRVSAQIHADKTNAATQKYRANEVDARRANQQNRIADGIASGKLNAAETAKLERKEAGLNKQVAAARKANGGNLTNNQKRQINREQDKVSGQIHNDKTN